MDKFEYKIRAEEIRNLIANREYAEAADVADTIDWRRVKSVMMLCTISDLYKINRRFEDSKELLLLAYERHPGGRTIVYSLCELSIKMEEYVQAIEYYKEFVQLAPKDTGRYILQYKLYEAQEVSLEERIAVLEEFKRKEYREKWAYELAYLYHRIGLATKCVEECDELILWFGEGKYVTKAMELKMLHAPLTAEQQMKYSGRITTDSNGYAVEETTQPMEDEDNPIDVSDAPTVEIPSSELDIQVKTMDVGRYNTINLQKELAESMKDLWEGKKPEASSGLSAVPQTEEQVVTEEYFADPNTQEMGNVTMLRQDTDDITEIRLHMEEAQAEESEAERIEAEENGARGEDASSEAVWQAAEEEKAQEIVQEETTAEVEAAKLSQIESVPEASDEVNGKDIAKEQTKIKEQKVPESGDTASMIMEQMKMEAMGITEPKADSKPDSQTTNNQESATAFSTIKTPVKSKFDNFIGMELDGQLSLVVPEAEQLEKQITGQIRIEDILSEWEKLKKQNEEKRAEEVRQRVLEHTGNILVDFDALAKAGILGSLDSGIEGMTEEELEQFAQDYEETKADNLEKEAYAEESVEVDEAEELSDEEEAQILDEYQDVSEETQEAEINPDEEELQETEMDADEEELQEAEIDADEEEVQEAEIDADEEELQEAEIDAGEEELQEAEIDADEEELQEAEESEISDEQQKQNDSEDNNDTEDSSSASNSAKLRELSKEEKEMFASFIQNRKAKEQLIQALDNITLAAYTGNLIVTGDEGMNTVKLAQNVLRDVKMTDGNFSGKIAKISGETLAKKNLEAILQKLSNGALIIENAGKIEEESMNKLLKALENENQGIIVALEGTKKAINKLISQNEAIEKCFTSRIDIEALDNDTLVNFAKKYAREQEYSIDDLGVLALHTIISDNQTSNHAVTILEVKEIVDDAIRHANRKTPGHFFDILLAKRYDEEDMIILREKDFLY